MICLNRNSKEFEIEIFCDIINIFTVPLDQFNACLHKLISLKKILLTNMVCI